MKCPHCGKTFKTLSEFTQRELVEQAVPRPPDPAKQTIPVSEEQVTVEKEIIEADKTYQKALDRRYEVEKKIDESAPIEKGFDIIAGDEKVKTFKSQLMDEVNIEVQEAATRLHKCRVKYNRLVQLRSRELAAW